MSSLFSGPILGVRMRLSSGTGAQPAHNGMGCPLRGGHPMPYRPVRSVQPIVVEQPGHGGVDRSWRHITEAQPSRPELDHHRRLQLLQNRLPGAHRRGVRVGCGRLRPLPLGDPPPVAEQISQHLRHRPEAGHGRAPGVLRAECLRRGHLRHHASYDAVHLLRRRRQAGKPEREQRPGRDRGEHDASLRRPPPLPPKPAEPPTGDQGPPRVAPPAHTAVSE